MVGRNRSSNRGPSNRGPSNRSRSNRGSSNKGQSSGGRFNRDESRSSSRGSRNSSVDSSGRGERSYSDRPSRSRGPEQRSAIQRVSRDESAMYEADDVESNEPTSAFSSERSTSARGSSNKRVGRGRGHSTNVVRLHKYLADCGVASRRAAEELIENGEVYVNNQLVTTQGMKITPGRDEVRVRKRIIRPVELGVLLFYKPKNVITTLDDPEGRPTVADYLSVKYRSYYPVGRLDFDSTGLVVMTNDGDLAHHLMHPKFNIDRTYELRVEGDLTHDAVAEIAEGVALDDGPVKGKVQIKGQGGARTTKCLITITEGRNRVIRRLFDHLGFPVLELHRIAHGPFKLGNLKPGQIDRVPESVYQSLRARLVREA